MLPCQRERFNLPSDISYLNCAYMSPQLREVESVGHQQLLLKNNPAQISPSDFFEPVNQLKAAAAKLLGVENEKRIAILPSASYGLATVAHNLSLKKEQNIVVAEEQFPSNYYSWKRKTDQVGAQLRVAAVPKSAISRSQVLTDAVLKQIDENTALVALAQVHWTDGALYDLNAIGQKARSVGALLVLDGTQSIGALPFDLEQIQPDALICASYKWLLGPYSIGIGYFGPAFDEAIPIEESWMNRYNSEDFQHLVNYENNYQPYAGRFSVGEQSNFLLVPMLKMAIQQIQMWGIANIQEYTRSISQKAIDEIRDLGAKLEPDHRRCGHLFGIRLGENFDGDLLQQAFKESKVYVSMRGDAVRIAPHLYNTEADFERLSDCFKKARKRVLL